MARAGPSAGCRGAPTSGLPCSRAGLTVIHPPPTPPHPFLAPPPRSADGSPRNALAELAPLTKFDRNGVAADIFQTSVEDPSWSPEVEAFVLALTKQNSACGWVWVWV